MKTHGQAGFSLLLGALLLTGCAAGTPTAFYTLNSTISPHGTASDCCSVAVGPVWIPGEVDRPQFVLTQNANLVSIDEYHRWAAPLQASIQRVVADDLAHLLGSPSVSLYPDGLSLDAAYRVEIQVLHFDSVAGRAATQEALWKLQRTKDGVTRSGRSRVEEPVGASSADALAAAHSRALGALSKDIASALQALDRLPLPPVSATRAK